MKNKLGVVMFHKNIKKIYKEEWVTKCINSVLNQTIKDFTIYEINYGEDDLSLLDGIDVNKRFYSETLENYADAMNFIITKAFDDGCDYVFNTNLDDYYKDTRFEKQLTHLSNGYDVVSSDFCYIQEQNNGEDRVIHHMNIKKHGPIKDNLDRNHNVIAHPVVGMSNRFWVDVNNRYDITKTPSEDLDLWKRSINNYKFYIIDEILLFYRIHDNQVSVKR